MSTHPFHIVACIFPIMGHVRPTMATLTVIAEKYKGAIITVLLFHTLVSKSHDEIKRSGISPEAAARIRMIGLSDAQVPPGLASIPVMFLETTRLVPEVYANVIKGETVTCSATGSTFDYAGIPVPSLALSDYLSPYTGETFKAITPQVKLFVFWATVAGCLVRRCGPEKLGGAGAWGARTRELQEKDPSLSFNEAAEQTEKIYKSGKPVPNPENVPYYDFEVSPQHIPNKNVVRQILDANRVILEVADGVALATTETFEPKATKALRHWYEEELHKKIFFTGPLDTSKLISGKGATSADSGIPERYTDIFKFLDARPSRTVWLISFGTLFFPHANPNQLVALLKTLLKTSTPFILSLHALSAMYAPLAADLRDDIDKSGLGMVVDFVPQQEVLQHPSVAAFITHGGINSTFETIATGVVPVFWPFAADQPNNAAYLTMARDCAFELIQVRTGEAARDPLRGGKFLGTDEAIAAEVEQIIHELRGEVGERKRKNLANVRAALEEAFTNGQVSAAIEDLISFAEGR